MVEVLQSISNLAAEQAKKTKIMRHLKSQHIFFRTFPFNGMARTS